MDAVFGLVALVVALIGLLAALGHVGYLAMLNSAARRRGSSGMYAVDYVTDRWKVAGATTAVAALGLLLTSGSLPLDVLGMLLGGGAGLVAKRQLDGTRSRFRNEA